MDFDKPKVYGDTSITDGLVFPSNRLKSFKYICATYLTVHLFLCADKTHCKKALSFEEEEKNNHEWPFAETVGEDGLK